MQAAQRFNFAANFVHKRRQFHARIAALKPVLHLCTWKLVQHHLHHGELVQVRVQQTGNDHVEAMARKLTLQCT